MKIGFIVNPRAGVRKSAYEEIKKYSERYLNGHQVKIHLTTGPGDATQIARFLVKDGYDVVASAGGDGTANETAQGLIDSQTAFTIIPYGSGNGLARGLSIPLDPSKAVAGIPAGQYRTIDVGELWDGPARRLFFGFAGIGYDAFVGKLFNKRKGRRGLLAYVYLSIAAYREYTPIPVKIRFADREIFSDPFILAVANTDEYGNGARIAPHALPDDGQFDVTILMKMTFLKGLLNGWRMFNGTIDLVKDVMSLRIPSIEVTPESSIFYHTDGETRETTNALRFQILPNRLKVLIPN